MSHRFMSFDLEISDLVPLSCPLCKERAYPEGRKGNYRCKNIDCNYSGIHSSFKSLPSDEWRPANISCGATLLESGPEGGEMLLWYPGVYKQIYEGHLGGRMSKEDARSLVDYLLEGIDHGYTPLSWNGASFDFHLLGKHSGMIDECAQMALDHVDVMFHFLCIKGYPLALQTAALGQNLDGKIMEGIVAPILWKDVEGDILQSRADRLKVLEYVAGDTKLLMELACMIEVTNKLDWISQKGKANTCNFPVGLKTVREALRMNRPNTSWMDNPLDPDEMVEWALERE